MALGKVAHDGGQSDGNAMAIIADFKTIKAKIDEMQDEHDHPITVKVNKMMGEYQMKKLHYLFSCSYRFAFFMGPFQMEMLANAAYIFTDITFTGNRSFPYLLNIVTLCEQTLQYVPVARVLCNKQDGKAYGTAFGKIFETVTATNPEFKCGGRLELILVDFDDSEANGLKQVIGEEKASQILRGCIVHWNRSLNRVAKLVTKTKEEKQVFLKLGKQIPETSRKEDVLKMFQVLSGNFRMDEARQFLADVPNEMEMSHCLKLKRWAEWWCIENHLRMFTIAFSETSNLLI